MTAHPEITASTDASVPDAPPCTPPCREGAGLALAEHSVAFAQQHAGVVLTAAGRVRLVDVVVALIAQLEEWAADPVGGPPDPWTFLRRRWHRQDRFGWWGILPATTRRMLTGVEPFGRDSLIQIAWRATFPCPPVVSRWRSGLLDFDPAADPGAARRLAARRASRRGARVEGFTTA